MIYTAENAKVVADACETEVIQLLAVLAILHQDDFILGWDDFILKSDNFILFLNLSWCKIASEQKI